MGKIFVFILKKKSFATKERSIDQVLKYLKTNNQLDSSRWLLLNGESTRIGRTSMDYIVIPYLLDLNLVIEKFVPGLVAFEIKKSEWRKDKYHKTIIKNPNIKIDEDEKHYFIEVSANGA